MIRPMRIALAATLLLVLTTCDADPSGDLPAEACVDRCLSFQPSIEALTDANGHDFDAGDYQAACAAIDVSTCDDCWVQISELFLRRYEVYADCWCSLPDDLRDPGLEAAYECDRVIAETYGSEADFEAACACG